MTTHTLTTYPGRHLNIAGLLLTRCTICGRYDIGQPLGACAICGSRRRLAPAGGSVFGRYNRYNSADWTAGRREKLRTSSAAQHSPNS